MKSPRNWFGFYANYFLYNKLKSKLVKPNFKGIVLDASGKIRTLKVNFKLLLLFILIYFPIFGQLDTIPLRLWDEARQGVQAIEMLESGNPIVVTFGEQADHWSTKPPMMVWFQAISMKIFGAGLLGLRLPSALAAFLTCLLLIRISYRHFKMPWLGLISAMVLATSGGFIDIHGSRTGDIDATLSLFTTFYVICFYLFIELKNTKYLYWTCIGIACAALTKSIAGLLFLPGLLIYSIWKGALLDLLKNKHFYIAALIPLLSIIGYYSLREALDPGYLQAVIDNELGNRLTQNIEGHHGTIWYYFYELMTLRKYQYWYLLIPVGITLGLFHQDKRIGRLIALLICCIIPYYLVISIAQTKLHWYDLPIYPFYAIIIGSSLHMVFQYLTKIDVKDFSLGRNVLPYIFLFLVFVTPYRQILKKTFQLRSFPEQYEEHRINEFFHYAMRDHFDVDGLLVAHNGTYNNIRFYILCLRRKGIEVATKNWERLEANDEVIAHQPICKNYIEANYNWELIQDFKNVRVYKILGRKS